MKTSIRQRLSNSGKALRHKQFRAARLSVRIATALLVVLGFNCADGFFTRAAEPSATIRVRIVNYTEVTPDTIARAEREAGRIFHDAGLNVVWLDCPLRQTPVNPADPCQQPLGPANVFVRLLSDQTRKGIQDSVFGFAVLPALASVYYGTAVNLARSYGAEIDIPTILGCVMVHEIGHLLLGSNSHSETGIMQGQWGRKQVRELIKGDLLFTRQQSKLIRAEGQTRMSLEATQLRASSSRG